MASQYITDGEDWINRADDAAGFLKQRPGDLYLVLKYWMKAAYNQNQQLDLLDQKLDRIETLVKQLAARPR